MRLISANVNGIRAAARRGGLRWLAAQHADVIALQEVRATDDQLREALTDGGLGAWRVSSAQGRVKGHAGVAILTRQPPTCVTSDIGPVEFTDAGRWLEVDVRGPDGPVTVISAYVHTGEALTPKQEEKFRFLDAVGSRLEQLAENDGYAVLTGDLNICHSADDLKNWKGNLGKAGFLPGSRRTSIGGSGSTATVTSTARSTVLVRGPTRGGRGVARPSTMTPDGASTTSSRAPPWRSWRRVRRWAERRHTPSAGVITQHWRSITT